MSETFYDVLGVSPDATTDEITDAYRDRIKETHPDVSDDPDAAEQAKRVIEAKEILTDETERNRYDRLGHATYVQQSSVDADWGGGPAANAGNPSSAGRGSRGPTGATHPGDDGWTSTEGSTWAGRDERRRGRTAADWDEDFADARGDTADAGATDDAGAQAGASASASASGASAQAEASAGASGADGKRRRTTASNVGDAVGWASGVDGRHAVRHGQPTERVGGVGIFPPQDSLILLISTFVCYPSLVFTSFYPPFPLFVNIVVGICTLLIVGYLMSIPDVGVYVFGAWSVLATLITLVAGFSPLSLLGVILLGSTWIPLALTLVTYQVLRY